MSTVTRLSAYVAILVVVLFAAYGVGKAVGPIGTTAVDTHQSGQNQHG